MICRKELNHSQALRGSKTCGYIYCSQTFRGEKNSQWKGKIAIRCKYCDSTFQIYPSQLKHYPYKKKGVRKYCSKTCEGLAKRGKNNCNYKEYPSQFCKVCGKVLTRKQIMLKINTCSYECSYKYRDQRGRKGPSWKEVGRKFCPICEKELTHIQIIAGCVTCSLACGYKIASKNLRTFYASHPDFRSRERHPNWRNGSSRLPHAPDFDSYLKEEIKKRDGYKCLLCGMPELETLERRHNIHHIDYDKFNSNPKNLITLCSSCHSKTNYNRRYWQDYFQKLMKKEGKHGDKINFSYAGLS